MTEKPTPKPLTPRRRPASDRGRVRCFLKHLIPPLKRLQQRKAGS